MDFSRKAREARADSNDSERLHANDEKRVVRV